MTTNGLTLALILTFSPGEKEQRRGVRVARAVGVRLQRCVVAVLSHTVARVLARFILASRVFGAADCAFIRSQWLLHES